MPAEFSSLTGTAGRAALCGQGPSTLIFPVWAELVPSGPAWRSEVIVDPSICWATACCDTEGAPRLQGDWLARGPPSLHPGDP